MNEEYDLIVIGGGPGGYTAAIRAAQLGGRVVLIEKNKLGGVCNNYGCIPSKTMINLAEIQSSMKVAETFGISFSKTGFDLKKMVEKRNELVDKLANGVEFLLKSNGVKVVYASARVKSQSEVECEMNNEKYLMKCRKIIIATGSSSIKSGIFSKSKKVMTSEEFLYSNELPKDVIIIGGGPEGMEFASMLSNFGSNVTIIEMQNRLLPLEDADISAVMHKQLSDNGVHIITNAKVTDVFDQSSRVGVKLSDKMVNADMILISTGRSPNLENLSALNLRHDKKNNLLVNEKMETSIKGVYAIGDVTGGRYAHEAMQNGIVAAENAMGLNSSMKNQVIPRCIYTTPEIASVGMSESDAKKITNILVGKVTLKSSGRAMTMGDTNGIVKVIIDKRKKKILGLHIVNERASDMIGEGVLAMKYLTTDELIDSIHPHPTLSESVREAVMDAYGIPIHSISRNKKNRPKSLRQYS